MAGILDAWSRHAQTTQAMKGNTGMGVIPNYGYSSGADFQANFPNLDPRVTAVLASGYQLGQEGLRALNPFGNTFLDFKGAYKTAAEQAAENIRGALELNQKVISPEQLALNQKYANSVLQGKSVYNTPELASDKGVLNSVEDFFFAPANADAIPTEAERQAVEKNIQDFDLQGVQDIISQMEEEKGNYIERPENKFNLEGIMQNIGNFAKDYAGRYIGSQALGGAGAMLLGPIGGLVGGIAGLLGGGNLFNQNTYSQQMYNNLTSEGKQYADRLYGPGGILQGYNQFSAFGRGTLGTIGNILAKNPNMSLARQGAFRKAANDYINSIDPTQQGINAVTKPGGYAYDDAAIKYAPPSGGDSGGWSGGSGGFGGGFSTSSSGTEETF